MNEENGSIAELIHGIQQQNSVKDNASPSDDRADDEMKVVLSALKSLPFKDEDQKASLLKNVQRLQDYHVAQIFNLGVAPLHTSMTEPSEFVEEVITLFEICFSSCYTADVTKRVAFDYFVKALKFCFPSPPKQCLTTAAVSMLLQLARVLQEGKIAEIVCEKPEQIANTEMQINGPKHFIEELLTILETRRDGGCITKIVSQTLRFASADASVSCIQEHVVGNLRLRNEHVVSPVFLRHWMRLLKLEHVSNGFASALAKKDALRVTKESVPLLSPILPGIKVETNNLLYDSIVLQFVSTLEEMNRRDGQVSLPTDGTERWDMFFKHINHFYSNRHMTVTFLRLLASTSISNEVLEQVLDTFFCKQKLAPQHPQSSPSEAEAKGKAFHQLFQVLSLFPDGNLVNRVLEFFHQTFPVDADYQNLAILMTLLAKGLPCESPLCLEERAERTFNFLNWLPPSLLPFVQFWHPFLSCFIRMFPGTFHNRPEVLGFIHKAQLAAKEVPAEKRQGFVLADQILTLHRFLNWISLQYLSEQVRNEMIGWLMRYTDDGSLGQTWDFSLNVIIQLSLCQQLPFSSKEVLLRELNNLAKQFKEQNERMVFLKVIRGLRSPGSLEFTNEILSEILGFLKRFVDKDRPMKTIPSDVLKLLSLVSTVPISGDRRMKILKRSKASGPGLLNGIRILDLLEWYHVTEEANEYFDLLYTAFVDQLKEDKDLCEKFYKQQRVIPGSTQIQKEWISEVAKSISLGSCNEEVDLCCLTVLQQAFGMSKVEMLQLFSQLKGSAEEIMRKQNEIQSFPGPPSHIPGAFISSIAHVVGSIKFSGEEKLLLVREVCDIFLQYSNVLAEKSIENALCHLIPIPCSQNSSSPSNEVEAVHLKSVQILAMLKDPTIMAQLSRIPADTEKSLCAVLSKINYDSSSRDKLAEIYSFIGTLEDLDDGFFTHFLSVLEVTIQESKSMEIVMEIMREMVCVISAFPSTLISLVMLCFQYLLENHVSKQAMERFLNEVEMKWDSPPDANVLRYLKVPQLLWNMYSTTDCQGKRCELVQRMQEILEGTNQEVENYCRMGLEPGHDIVRQISCCELEWLVFHSPLSNNEATLAYNLCFRSLKLQIKCFAFAALPAVCIEEGHLTVVPQETTSDKDNVTTPLAQALESRMLGLTPISVAQKMIQHLRPILGPSENLNEIAFLLWDTVFSSPTTLLGCDAECVTSSYFLDEYLDVFLSMLTEASSTDVLLYWVRQNKHYVSQCSDVILKACKKTREAEEIDKESRLNFHVAVYNTMETVRKRTPATSSLFFGMIAHQPASCFRIVKPQLNHLSNMLGSSLSIEVTLAVLDLFQISVQAGVAVGEIVSSWSSKNETLKLIKSVKTRCQKEEMSALHNNAAQSEFVWQLAKVFGRLCMNSCKDILAKIEELVVLFDPEDAYSLNRLPGWRQVMITDGFPAHPIDCWCASFLATPHEDLSSRDVDAIVDLKAVSLQLVASVSQSIKSCVFPEDGFEVSLEGGIKETQTKERLRLARLLSEFINMLKITKPEENRKASIMKEIVVDACDDLCKARAEQKRRNELYKIHGQKLKALFTEVFGKQCKPDAALARQTDGEEARVATSFARQTSHLHENLPRVLSCTDVYEPLLLLLRRWLSGIVTKPVLAAHTQEIVQLLFSAEFSDERSARLRKMYDAIQARILSLENNKALIAQLQAAGYNQKDQGSRDLWSSPSVECPGYLSKRESQDFRRYRKKLVQVLRNIWNEWKDILLMLGIASIKVGETDVCTKDLFGLQDSLEEIEEQVSAVKKEVSQFNLEDLERRVTQLVRQEQRHRARIEKLHKSNKSSAARGSEKGPMKKFVAVWENRFLENVKLCSELIPACYAPNGFHSEKPVLCALSVDNRILTVFKEEKNGRREEIENVEVKLFEAGMYVYGLYTSGHDYVTDELWAAFYKMLLEETLVPRIVLSNKSPGFDWIKKHKFVQTETSHPFPWKWELHQGIVPPEEDYFEYPPIQAALWPALHGLTEFITLTRENVSNFQFDDFQDARAVEDKERRIKQLTGKAMEGLKNNKSIRNAVVGKLAFAVKQTIKRIVDGEQVTVETVEKLIDMNKLAYRSKLSNEDPDAQTRKECPKEYALAVLSACKDAAL